MNGNNVTFDKQHPISNVRVVVYVNGNEYAETSVDVESKYVDNVVAAVLAQVDDPDTETEPGDR